MGRLRFLYSESRAETKQYYCIQCNTLCILYNSILTDIIRSLNTFCPVIHIDTGRLSIFASSLRLTLITRSIALVEVLIRDSWD